MTELVLLCAGQTPLPCAEVTLKEAGLEGALFTLLDQESEPGLRRSIQDILIHMMASSSTSGKLGHWLKLCKDVLSASTGGWRLLRRRVMGKS